jgi:hypothetical protein
VIPTATFCRWFDMPERPQWVENGRWPTRPFERTRP